MEPYFDKVYKFEKSENFKEFLTMMGCSTLVRKFATSAKPKVSLLRNKDGTYTFASSAGLLRTKMIFSIGVEFEEHSFDGSRCRSLIIFHGNTMVHTQKGDKDVKIVREFSNEKLIMTIYADDFIARRYFKAV